MTRADALRYVAYALDDAGTVIPEHARLVGWQCGFEPLFVAVWSYLPGVRVDMDEAEELAQDYLLERKWFASGDDVQPADYVL